MNHEQVLNALNSLVPRRYQEEVFRRARRDNIIAALNTGAGKTFISLLLIKWVATQEAHKDKAIIFLVPRVALAQQQGDYISKHTSLRVIKLYGALDLDLSNRRSWRKRFKEHDVLVMTAQIFLDILTHSLWSVDRISLIVFDECHHARKNHPYNGILREYFQVQPALRPKIFGMTASPIWDAKNPAQSLQTLEKNMDAKVVGVIENYSELQEHSPRPLEIVKQYPPPSSNSDYPSPSIYSCVRIFEDDLRAISNSAWCNVEGRHFVTQYNLGPYCASLFLYTELLQVVASLERDELENLKGVPYTGNLTTSTALSVTAIREIVEGYRGFFPDTPQESIPIPVPLSWCTPKVKALTDILLLHYSPGFQAIIFVEQRQVAACLARLLPAIPELNDKIRSGHFVGEGVNAEGLSSSMGANIGDTLAAFRTGVINIRMCNHVDKLHRIDTYSQVVATSVAEEGLDFPACGLVIRFDSLQHMVGYIQSRGRARNKASTFVVMVQEDDAAQLARYKALKDGEPEIARVYLSRKDEVESDCESDEDVDPGDLCERERYVVPGTGAILNYDNSIGLLNRLCALIPTDAFTPPHKPIYSGDFAANLRLPTSLPLSEEQLVYQGPSRRSKKEAKRAVAFLAARRLQALDVLDEYLLPVPSEGLDSNLDATRDSPPLQVTKPENITVMVQDPWIMGARLWIHEIAINGRVSAGLVSGTRFSADTLYCRSNTIEIAAGRPVRFADEDELDVRRDMEGFTRLGVYYRLTGTPIQGGLSVFLVPVTVEGQPDFDAMSRLLANPRGSFDWTSIKEEHCGGLLVTVSLFYGRTYRLRRIRNDITPISIPIPGSREENFPCYRDYLIQRCGNGRYVPYIPGDGPMVELEQVPRILNGRYAPGSGSRIPDMAAVNDGGLFPQGCCRWLDFSRDTFQAFEFLPAICHRLTAWYRGFSLRSALGLPPINRNLLQEALTLPGAHAGYSNQRLETLGDAVLQLFTTVYLFNRYPNRHEGQLTSLRHTVVCNRFLYERATSSRLGEFLINESHNAGRWAWIVSESDGSYHTTRRVKRKIPSRSLQECTEAILGASFMSGGTLTALRAGQSLGLNFGEAELWYTQIARREESETAASSTSPYFAGLEDSLNYRFCRRRVLLEAVTHPSFSIDSGGRSYQRLEFLGDALLSLVVMEHLFTRYKEGTPYQLSLLRSKAVCNASLAWVAVKRLELHKVLLVNSVDLNVAISQSVPLLEAASGEDIVKNGWRYHPPKALGDVLESILGAIFVDSGYNYDKTAAIVLLIMQDVLEELSLDVGEDPVSRLFKWTAGQGCRKVALREVTKVFAGKPIKGMAVMVHETIVAGPMIGPSARVSKFAASNVALTCLMDLQGENGLDNICTCRINEDKKPAWTYGSSNEEEIREEDAVERMLVVGG